VFQVVVAADAARFTFSFVVSSLSASSSLLLLRLSKERKEKNEKRLQPKFDRGTFELVFHSWCWVK
jgi:hypothetical protein